MEQNQSVNSNLKSIVVLFQDFAMSNKIDKAYFEDFCKNKNLKYALSSGSSVATIENVEYNNVSSLINEIRQLPNIMSADVNKLIFLER